MMKQEKTPFIAHIFVCTNDREGDRESCADYNSKLIKAKLKTIIKDNGWKGKVRVSTSGCLGVCADGPNVMVYPQKTWFSKVDPDNIEAIVDSINQIMADQ